jgi:hypothetical protein
MTPREHIVAIAAGLASLPELDPEVVVARRHAASCPRCAEALDDGERLMALVDAAPMPSPREATLARIAQALAAQIASSPRWTWAPYAAVGVAWVLISCAAKAHSHDGAPWVMSAATFAFALGVVAVTKRGRRLPLVATVVASSARALATGTSGGFGSLHGVTCFAFELVAAAIPFGALALVALRDKRVGGALTFATVAAAGALVGQAALLVTCPERAHTPHVFATHVAGVVVAACLGGVGRTWVSRAASAT